MKSFKQWIAALGVASLAALPLAAQTASGTATPAAGESKPGAMAQSGKLAAADSKFVHDAAVGGMAEVEMGRLAAEKASSADVKQFGQRMVDDHGKANQELKGLASAKGVTVPASLDAAHKAAQEKLSKLTGAAFDRAYMEEMVKDHDKDVAAFRRASTTAADAELKAWAAKTLPTLEEHQKMSKSIHAKLGSAGAKSDKPGQAAGSK
jgi:putative membrane protein